MAAGFGVLNVLFGLLAAQGLAQGPDELRNHQVDRGAAGDHEEEGAGGTSLVDVVISAVEKLNTAGVADLREGTEAANGGDDPHEGQQTPHDAPLNRLRTLTGGLHGEGEINVEAGGSGSLGARRLRYELHARARRGDLTDAGDVHLGAEGIRECSVILLAAVLAGEDAVGGGEFVVKRGVGRVSRGEAALDIRGQGRGISGRVKVEGVIEVVVCHEAKSPFEGLAGIAEICIVIERTGVATVSRLELTDLIHAVAGVVVGRIDLLAFVLRTQRAACCSRHDLDPGVMGLNAVDFGLRGLAIRDEEGVHDEDIAAIAGLLRLCALSAVLSALLAEGDVIRDLLRDIVGTEAVGIPAFDRR